MLAGMHAGPTGSRPAHPARTRTNRTRAAAAPPASAAAAPSRSPAGRLRSGVSHRRARGPSPPAGQPSLLEGEAPQAPPPLAFSFSAGGLLFPYHWGVAAELVERGALDRRATPIGGASAGSIIVACLRSGLSFDRVTDACLSLAADCRANGTRTRLGPALEAMLRELLPEDVHERCSEGGTAHIAVARLFPPAAGAPPSSSSSSSSSLLPPPAPAPPASSSVASRLFRSELLSSFGSRDDLIGAVLTSSHIPWYLDGRATRTYRGGECLDGGLTQFIPSIPGTVSSSSSGGSRSGSSSTSSSGSESDGEGGGDAQRAQTRLVRVTCFPSRAVDAAAHRAARLIVAQEGGAGRPADAAALERAAAAAQQQQQQQQWRRGGSGAGAGGGAAPPPALFADLSPDRFADWGVSMREAVAMALEPAPEATLLALLDKGREDARLWMAANGVNGEGVAAAAASSSAARRGF